MARSDFPTVGSQPDSLLALLVLLLSPVPQFFPCRLAPSLSAGNSTPWSTGQLLVTASLAASHIILSTRTPTKSGTGGLAHGLRPFDCRPTFANSTLLSPSSRHSIIFCTYCSCLSTIQQKHLPTTRLPAVQKLLVASLNLPAPILSPISQPCLPPTVSMAPAMASTLSSKTTRPSSSPPSLLGRVTQTRLRTSLNSP
jgi:hypothetical protein